MRSDPLPPADEAFINRPGVVPEPLSGTRRAPESPERAVLPRGSGTPVRLQCALRPAQFAAAAERRCTARRCGTDARGLRTGLQGLERGPRSYASICTKYAIGTKIATPVIHVWKSQRKQSRDSFNPFWPPCHAQLKDERRKSQAPASVPLIRTWLPVTPSPGYHDALMFTMRHHDAYHTDD